MTEPEALLISKTLDIPHVAASNAYKPDKRRLNFDAACAKGRVKESQDRVRKNKEEVPKAQRKFDGTIQEITGGNLKYIEDRSDMFEKCQKMDETQPMKMMTEVNLIKVNKKNGSNKKLEKTRHRRTYSNLSNI